MKTIAICSGYFSPAHLGHIEYLKKSKAIADMLIVIVNTDKQSYLKKGFSFQSEDERMQIIGSMECVDEVVLSIDEDKSVSKTIEFVYNKYKSQDTEIIFTKGGDQTKEIIPEKEICEKLGIRIVDNIVGQLNSSSRILKTYDSNKEKLKGDK